MATILVLASSLFGFAAALASVFVFDASFLWGIAIWSGAGTFTALAILALALFPRAEDHTEDHTDHMQELA